jgi:hypothetical protein
MTRHLPLFLRPLRRRLPRLPFLPAEAALPPLSPLPESRVCWKTVSLQ